MRNIIRYKYMFRKKKRPCHQLSSLLHKLKQHKSRFFNMLDFGLKRNNPIMKTLFNLIRKMTFSQNYST